MRIVFNHLKYLHQWGTFFHFFEPFYIYWVLFSTCEKFSMKVLFG
jgi:hypothetical protein